MKKISKLAKRIDSVAKFLYRLCMGIGIFCVVFIIGVPFFTMDYYKDVTKFVDIGEYELEFVSGYMPDLENFKLFLVSMFVFIIIASVYACVALRIIRDILKPMTEESPFECSVSKNIRKLSWTVLIGEGLLIIGDFVTSIIQYNAFDYANLFINDKIIRCNIDYYFDVTFIVVFGILYLLSYVFQYGEELQVQSDETL